MPDIHQGYGFPVGGGATFCSCSSERSPPDCLEQLLVGSPMPSAGLDGTIAS